MRFTLQGKTTEYPFCCQTNIQQPNPQAVEATRVYGAFICVPYKMFGVQRWGFLTAIDRDNFVKQYGAIAL